jgi:hypothetical protein
MTSTAELADILFSSLEAQGEVVVQAAMESSWTSSPMGRGEERPSIDCMAELAGIISSGSLAHGQGRLPSMAFFGPSARGVVTI